MNIYRQVIGNSACRTDFNPGYEAVPTKSDPIFVTAHSFNLKNGANICRNLLNGNRPCA